MHQTSSRLLALPKVYIVNQLDFNSRSPIATATAPLCCMLRTLVATEQLPLLINAIQFANGVVTN